MPRSNDIGLDLILEFNRPPTYVQKQWLKSTIRYCNMVSSGRVVEHRAYVNVVMKWSKEVMRELMNYHY